MEPLTAVRTSSEGQTVGSGSAKPRFSESSQGNSGNGSSRARPVSPDVLCRCPADTARGRLQGGSISQRTHLAGTLRVGPQTLLVPDVGTELRRRLPPGWDRVSRSGTASSFLSTVTGSLCCSAQFSNQQHRGRSRSCPEYPLSFFPRAHYSG